MRKQLGAAPSVATDTATAGYVDSRAAVLIAAQAETDSATYVTPDNIALFVNQRVVALGVETNAADGTEPAAFIAAAGETPSYRLRFSNNTLAFDTTTTNAIHAAGQTPVISWMYGDGSSTLPNTTYTLTNLLAGNFDTYMTTWLNAAKALGYTIYVAWSAEMNGDWQQYSEGVNGNTTGQYALAWKYVHDFAASLGVTNIKWVWEVTAKFATSTPLAGLYPGDAYVDVVAMNGYNWGATQPGGWVDPPALYDPTLAEIATFTTSKPIWIGEMGCAPDDGGSKTAWYAAFFAWLPTSLVSMFIYYERVAGLDWKVTSGAGTAAAFTAGMASLRTITRATGPSVADPLRASIAAVGAASTASAAALYTPKGGPTRGWKGNSFTLALADANTVIDCQASTTVTVTVPLNSVVPFPIGTVITLLQYDIGTVVVAPVSGGVTLRTNSGLSALSQWSVVTLTKRQTDEWVITQSEPAGTGAPVMYVLKSGTWPARPTDSATVMVIWVGPGTEPTIVSSGTDGMRDNLDICITTAA